VLATAIWSALATYVIVLIVKALVGLRVDHEDEVEGLDIRAHGEQGYLF
jgi:Amt family ammonium transporter